MMPHTRTTAPSSTPIRCNIVRPFTRRWLVNLGIPITVIYGSDFSVAGYRDREFGAFLLLGYGSAQRYQSRNSSQRVARGGATPLSKLTARVSAARIADSGRFRGSRHWLPADVQPGGDPRIAPGAASRYFSGRKRPNFSAWRGSNCAQPDCAALYSLCRPRAADRPRVPGRITASCGVPERKMIFSPYCVNTAPSAARSGIVKLCAIPLRRELGPRAGRCGYPFFRQAQPAQRRACSWPKP